MKVIMAGIAGILVAACGPPSLREPYLPPASETAEVYKTKIAETTKASDTYLVYPSCDGAPPEAKSCGMISDRLLEGVAPYVTKVCAEPPDQPLSDGCRERFFATARTEFASRYDRADAAIVKARCASPPCPTLGAEELQWMTAHNEAVAADRNREIDGLVLAHRLDQDAANAEHARRAAEDEAWRAKMRAVGAALATALRSPSPSYMVTPSNVSCTSDSQCGYQQRCLRLSADPNGKCSTVVDQAGNAPR